MRLVRLVVVSRACHITEISPYFRSPGILLFNLIGTAPIGKFNAIANNSNQDQENYWVHEAITTDYVQIPRYYLFAEGQMWMTHCYAVNGLGTCDPDITERYASDGWRSETMPAVTLSDSRFAMFFSNRSFLTSARAGDPEILTRRNTPTLPYHTYRTAMLGAHYYYDPVAKVTARFATTYANNCNLANYGAEKELADR